MQLGLRTLAVAVRRLSADQYGEINDLLQEANQALENREEGVGRVFDIIESDMSLLGATAVEDQLQDGVAETLATLQAAGIKVSG